jgi:CRP/FNR family transcriptional regulator
MIATNTVRSHVPAPAVHRIGKASVVPISAPTRQRLRVRRGETLYVVGDHFKSLYVVRVGVLKSFTVSDDGLTQVTGFPMQGDVVGLDGIDTGLHQGEVVALEDCELYVLPFSQCERWTQQSAHGQRLMMRTMAHEIVRSQELMIMLGTMRAEQRVAIFLLDLSERYGHLGYARSQFVLRMTRNDIGSYLGLKLETVSRLLSHFQQQGLIQAQGKSISLLDFAGLWKASGLSPDNRPQPPAPLLDAQGELAVG